MDVRRLRVQLMQAWFDRGMAELYRKLGDWR